MNVTLFGKSDFADVIKLRIWRWADYPGYLVGPNNVITSVLIKVGQREIGLKKKRQQSDDRSGD